MSGRLQWQDRGAATVNVSIQVICWSLLKSDAIPSNGCATTAMSTQAEIVCYIVCL